MSPARKRSQEQGARPWPADARLIEMAATTGSMEKLALACGKSRGSLRDYLAIRPALSITVRTTCRANRAPSVPWSAGTSKYANEAEKREAKRASNRRWAKNQPPENRRYWNLYNRARRGRHPYTKDALFYIKAVLTHDVCAYCHGTVEHIDHITAVSKGGEWDWDNLTASCGSCNASKQNKPLLLWLTTRKEVSPCNSSHSTAPSTSAS